MELAKSCISELLGGAEPTSVTVEKVFSAVYRKYNIKKEDIIGSRRTKEVAAARHIAIYLVRTITEMSLPNIGKIFNRDHSTVMSSIEAAEKRLRLDPILEIEIKEMIKEITDQN
jgi:chromosomal replication initiator protein